MFYSLPQFLRLGSSISIPELPPHFNDTTDWGPLCKTIECLSQSTNTRLERDLFDRFNKTSQTAQKSALEALALHSLTSNRLRMLDVCQRILSLDALKQITATNDPQACAASEARWTPPQAHAFKQLSLPTSFQPDFFGKILRYFTNTVAWSYSVDLDAPPKNHWAAQSQITFFRTVIADAQWLSGTFLQFFTTTKKAALAASLVFVTLTGLKYLYHKWHLDTPSTLHADTMRNLTEEVKAGRCGATIERSAQIRLLEQCLSTPPGQQPRIPLLIGPPGVGKTQLLEGLAKRIIDGHCPQLTGKSVLAINTASLLEIGGWSSDGYASRIEALLRDLRGHEDRIILFFDEAHNAALAGPNATDAVSAPPLLESLKTQLLEKKILCVFATTEAEYEKHLASQHAFLSRTRRIDVPELSREATRIVLQERFNGNPHVVIDPSAYDAALKVAARNDQEANPRKAIHIVQDAINHVYAWSPQENAEKENILATKIRGLSAEFNQQRNQQPGWANSEAGKAQLQQLDTLEKEQSELQKKQAKAKALCDQIARLRTLNALYTAQKDATIHRLAKPEATPEASKAYLFLDHIILPTLRQALTWTAAQIEETIPLQVDAALIEKLYPDDCSDG